MSIKVALLSGILPNRWYAMIDVYPENETKGIVT